MADPTKLAREATGTAGETVDRTARAGGEAVQETVAAGLDATADLAKRSTDQALKMFGDFGEGGEALVRRSSQNIEAITNANAILARGFQDLAREWLGLPQALAQRNAERFGALLRCKSAADFVAVQGDFTQNNLRQILDSGKRIAEISTRITSEAATAITSRAAA